MRSQLHIVSSNSKEDTIRAKISQKPKAMKKHYVTFRGRKCYLQFGTYPNKSVSIQLITANTHEPWMVATVSLHERIPEPGHVLIKNWSENQGILEALILSGYIEDSGYSLLTGYVRANVCKLLIQPTE